MLRLWSGEGYTAESIRVNGAQSRGKDNVKVFVQHNNEYWHWYEYNGTSRYSGIIYLDNIHKRGNVVVSFVTDGSVTGRGFLLYYKLYSKRGASK